MVCKAIGKVEAYQYLSEEIQFQAPWDEMMICETGDFIARPIPEDKNDIYRIEKETFFQTYKQEEHEHVFLEDGGECSICSKTFIEIQESENG